MVSKKLFLGAAAVVAGFSVSSQAATVLTSGSTVDGWKISYPVGIQLFDDGGGSLTLEKGAVFTNIEGLVITFTQVSYSASSTISITDESITNLTGSNFSGFQFLVGNPLPGSNGTNATLESNAFNGTTPPWTTQSESSDKSTITLGGGNLADTDTATFGSGNNGGALVIDAAPNSSGLKKVIDLKEIPIGSVIPVPAAAWTGLSGLAGLALIGSAKRVRKILA